MNLPKISVALYLLVQDSILASLTEQEQRQERLFRARSDQDWASVWHQESHVRCRESLAKHLDWACEKDIYKVSRRKRIDYGLDWQKMHLISKKNARTFLRSRRPSTGSITDECCSGGGCTWEEYAEYCPYNHRIQTFPPQK